MELVSLVTGGPGGHRLILDSDCCASRICRIVSSVCATCQDIELRLSRNHVGKLKQNLGQDLQRMQDIGFQDRRHSTCNRYGSSVVTNNRCGRRRLHSTMFLLYGRWTSPYDTFPTSSMSCLPTKRGAGYLAGPPSRHYGGLVWIQYRPIISVPLLHVKKSCISTVRGQSHSLQLLVCPCERGRNWMQKAVEDTESMLEDQDGEKYKTAPQYVNGESNFTQGERLQRVCVETTDSREETKGESLPPEGFIIFMSCIIGLLTGICVVLFNRGEHWLHDLLWHGVSGPAWLRLHSADQPWQQVIFIPAAGGMAVGLLNALRSTLDAPSQQKSSDELDTSFSNGAKLFFKPVIKAASAIITLGTGNSLGPEGPSVEIGASVASGVGSLVQSSKERKLSFIAAGSAAGISSGFNAAVAGCFFAVESVLGRVSGDNTSSLTTALIILSSVLATVVSQAGLGFEPAFRIPAYDFRSPAELPLYLLLGILCGVVSVALTKGSMYATVAFDSLKARGVPAAILPSLGGLCVGLIALAYPEILYWGFENVEFLLQSRLPWVKNPPADLLIQLVGVKVVATSLCRGSGLVGGVYAPSLFIGAALGSAYGSMVSYAVANSDPIYHLDMLRVAAPQAYALVGMAATLAGVCQVPLTSVLLLFELTHDYRIILPLMGGVGLSSWIASGATRKREQNVVGNYGASNPSKQRTVDASGASSAIDSPTVDGGVTDSKAICAIDSSLCLTTLEVKEEDLKDQILVAVAMRSNFAVVSPEVSVREAVSVMIERKEWCVLLVNDDGLLEGILTLGDVQEEAERAIFNGSQIEVDRRSVSKVCKSWSSKELITVYPDITLRAAERRMVRRGIRQLPVVARDETREIGRLVMGVLDKESIARACRAEATRRMLMLPQPDQLSAQL